MMIRAIKDMIECLFSYDLTTFQFLGQIFVKFFVGILVQMMTPEGHFEISWPLEMVVQPKVTKNMNPFLVI